MSCRIHDRDDIVSLLFGYDSLAELGEEGEEGEAQEGSEDGEPATGGALGGGESLDGARW